MNIIVTGGAGFIGSNFVFYMLEKHPEDRIICVDSLTYAGNLSTLESVMDNPQFRFVKLDIRDRMVDSDLWGESRIENVRTTLYYDIFLEDLENIADGYQSVRNEAAFRRYKVLDLDYVEYQNAVMQSYYSMYGGSY